MIQLRISGATPTVQTFPTVNDAKNAAARVGWLTSKEVREYLAFVAVNDYGNRIVHEYDPDTNNWFPCEMADDAEPKGA